MGEVLVAGSEILKNLIIFKAVTKYKSVARAMRGGDVTKFGTLSYLRDLLITELIPLLEKVLTIEQ